MTAPRDHHFIPAFYLKQWAGLDGKHQSSVLVLQDVAVIHEGMLPRRWPIEDDEKLGPILDKNYVLPPRKVSRRRLTFD
jgi:hypothetical protein